MAECTWEPAPKGIIEVTPPRDPEIRFANRRSACARIAVRYQNAGTMLYPYRFYRSQRIPKQLSDDSSEAPASHPVSKTAPVDAIVAFASAWSGSPSGAPSEGPPLRWLVSTRMFR